LASSNPIAHTQSYSQILPKNSRLTKILDEEYIIKKIESKHFMNNLSFEIIFKNAM